MKKKTFISVFTFILLFTGVFIYLNKVFISNHYYINTIEDFKVLAKKTNIDLLFIGSSHSFRSFNPLIIDNNCKTISYNLGADAYRNPLTSLILEEALKYTKPELVVLEIHKEVLNSPVSDKAKGMQLRGLDFVSNYSLSKFKKVREIYEYDELINVYFPLIRNHSKWNSKSIINLSKRSSYQDFYSKGFLGSINELKDKLKYKDFKTIEIKVDSSQTVISNENKKEIIDFVKYAKSKNIETIIVTSPMLRARYSNYYFYKELQEICSSLNIKYLNFNDYFDEIDLSLNDFMDSGHLNIKGSIKVTNYFSKYLNKEFSLTDRSSEGIWKDSNKAFQDFKYIHYYKDITFVNNETFVLAEDCVINKIKIIRNKENHKCVISLKDFTLFKDKMENYKLAVHIFPKESDVQFLNNRSIKNDWKFELADIRLKGQEENISFKFTTKIKNIDYIELYLYDASGYKGVVGKSVKIKDVNF